VYTPCSGEKREERREKGEGRREKGEKKNFFLIFQEKCPFI